MKAPGTSSPSQTNADSVPQTNITMDQGPVMTEPAGVSSTGQNNQLRVFVALVTVRVLKKCCALKSVSQEVWVSHAKRLVDETMEGLHIPDASCLEGIKAKKVCKAVMKHLQKMFGGRRSLESLIKLQDSAVDQALVESVQSQIRLLAAEPSKSSAQQCHWRDTLKVMSFVACMLIGYVVFMVLVP